MEEANHHKWDVVVRVVAEEDGQSLQDATMEHDHNVQQNHCVLAAGYMNNGSTVDQRWISNESKMYNTPFPHQDSLGLIPPTLNNLKTVLTSSDNEQFERMLQHF